MQNQFQNPQIQPNIPPQPSYPPYYYPPQNQPNITPPPPPSYPPYYPLYNYNNSFPYIGEKKSSKTKIVIIVSIVILFILLVVGLSVGLYFGLRKKTPTTTQPETQTNPDKKETNFIIYVDFDFEDPGWKAAPSSYTESVKNALGTGNTRAYFFEKTGEKSLILTTTKSEATVFKFTSENNLVVVDSQKCISCNSSVGEQFVSGDCSGADSYEFKNFKLVNNATNKFIDIGVDGYLRPYCGDSDFSGKKFYYENV